MTKKRRKHELDRREFLKASTAAALTAGVPLRLAFAANREGSAPGGRKVIVIGFDGMDPRLTEEMMDEGRLPAMAKLRQAGGYRRLGTTIPPQTPVAFASFITGTNPGGHGIFDFMCRDPAQPGIALFSAAGTSRGSGAWEVGQHQLRLTFWPFDHEAPEPVLYRRGVPFWNYLDEQAIPTWIWEVPSNFPPSPAPTKHHRSLAGLGTPDMLGTYGMYQHFAQNGPYPAHEAGGGRQSRVIFKNHSATATLVGPPNTFLKTPEHATIDFAIHRDRDANAAMIEIQGHRVLLKQGQWSHWIQLDFRLGMPSFMPDEHASGICRFFLQEVAPTFRLYVTPINIDPSAPALQISQPASFIEEVSEELGLFYTAGFQEDHKALSEGIFTDQEYIQQTDMVLEERYKLLDYALEHFRSGFMFFYFACTDLQPHMFWWDTDEKHPTRSAEDARKGHEHVKELYAKMDATVGELLDRYGDDATIMAMSDHGFANFRRQFSLCRWLRDNGYVHPADCESLADVDWSRTRAYGMGLNGLYLNLAGRERDGIVKPGNEREELIAELTEKLLAIRDEATGRQVIHRVYRADEVYDGLETKWAPDLIIGYHRDYRCSWGTALGDMTEELLSDNTSAWAADHCLAAEDVPGVLFANRPIAVEDPTLIDLAPTILARFGVAVPPTMLGRDVFDSSGDA